MGTFDGVGTIGDAMIRFGTIIIVVVSIVVAVMAFFMMFAQHCATIINEWSIFQTPLRLKDQ